MQVGSRFWLGSAAVVLLRIQVKTADSAHHNKEEGSESASCHLLLEASNGLRGQRWMDACWMDDGWMLLCLLQIVGPADGSSYIVDYYGARLTHLAITNETYRKPHLSL